MLCIYADVVAIKMNLARENSLGIFKTFISNAGVIATKFLPATNNINNKYNTNNELRISGLVI